MAPIFRERVENMKNMLLSLFLVILVLSIGHSNATFDFVFLKDLPPSSPLADVQWASNDSLRSIILLPRRDFDNSEVEAIISRIDRLPASLLSKLETNHIHIQLFTNRLTDNPSASGLRGLTPRGYADTSITWDEVPGAGGGRIVLVKIGASDKGKGHGSVNLELHELAHSIDQIVFNGLRHDPEFLRIWEEEKGLLFANRDYFLLHPEEYFAETFAMFYANIDTKNQLKKLAPQTFAFLSKIQ